MSSSWGTFLKAEEAKRNLCEALREVGATIYGWYPEDRGDPTLDHYRPPSWNGIATFGGFVIAVSASTYDAESYSGKEDGSRSDQDTYPVFQANTKGYSWHIEKDGEIYAQGKGLNKLTAHGHHYETVDEYKRLPREAAAVLALKIVNLIHKFNQTGMEPGLHRESVITGMEPMIGGRQKAS